MLYSYNSSKLCNRVGTRGMCFIGVDEEARIMQELIKFGVHLGMGAVTNEEVKRCLQSDLEGGMSKISIGDVCIVCLSISLGFDLTFGHRD